MPTVVADVVGGERVEVDLASDATYGDLLRALEFNAHEATALVDGDPVPADRGIDPDAERVRVLRLIRGGDGIEGDCGDGAENDGNGSGTENDGNGDGAENDGNGGGTEGDCGDGGGTDDRRTDARIAVRPATDDDHLDVMRVVDGAALAADAGDVCERIDRGEALVAAVGGSVVGALVRDGDRVTAVAVRRRWRDRGAGTALVEAALADRGRLVAEFDAGVWPFYASLGFDVEWAGSDRHRGELEGERAGSDRFRSELEK